MDGRGSSSGAEQRDEYLVLVMQDRHLLSRPTWFSLDPADEVWVGRGTEQAVQTTSGRRGVAMEISIPDPCISTDHARLVRSGRRRIILDEESKNGLCVGGLRVQRAVLESGDLVEIGNSLLLYRSERSRARWERSGGPDELVVSGLTSLPSLRGRLLEAAALGSSDVPVLLAAEPGFHLQPVAKALHAASRRAGGFVAVPGAGGQPGRAEAVLRGVRQATGGTLYVGDVDRIPFGQLVEVRDRCIARGTWLMGGAVVARGAGDPRGVFRHLAAVTLPMPPVRERREDLGLLLAPLVADRTGGLLEDLPFTLNAGRALLSYGWPLNADELATAAAAIAAVERGVIGLSDLPSDIRSATVATNELDGLSDEERARCDQLVRCLERHRGNISAVARDMDKGRTQVRRWLVRFGIDVQRFRVDPRGYRDRSNH